MGTRVVAALAAVVAIALIIGGIMFFNNNSNKSASASPAPGATPATKLEITDETVGTGAEAKVGDQITVAYTGMLASGTVFDSTDKHGGQPATFRLAQGQLIDGWVQGIPGMKVGGKRKLVIPPALGYGAQGTPDGSIPGNSTLIFEITLIGVTPA